MIPFSRGKIPCLADLKQKAHTPEGELSIKILGDVKKFDIDVSSIWIMPFPKS